MCCQGGPTGGISPRPAPSEDNYADEDNGLPVSFNMGLGESDWPEDFDSFKDQIDSHRIPE